MIDDRHGPPAFVLLAALGLVSGCFESHQGDGAPWPPVTGTPGVYEIGPAPGEGTVCPALPVRPPAPCGAEDGGLCDSEALARALAAASPGDIVRVGRCRVVAALTVPPGVSLVGVDPTASFVVAPAGPGGQAAITLRAGGAPTVARCLTVEANGGAGIAAEGPGEARVEYTIIHAPTGLGVEAEGVGRLFLHGLEVIGPVTRGNADGQPLEPTPEVVGTVAVQLIRVGEATIYGTSIAGFAAAGLLVAESPVTIRGLWARENLGAGALFVGGPVCVRQLSAETSLQGSRLIPTYGIVLTDGAEFHGAEVSVVDTEGYGILADRSNIDVEALDLRDNGTGGLWVQGGGDIAIRGPGTRIDGNGTAGVFACHADSVTISDVEVSHTESRVRIFETMPLEIGAGVILGAVPRVDLTQLRLVDNATAGLVLDLGAAPSAEIDDVFVTGTGAAFGAVAFDSTRWLGVGGWDDGVTRGGATVVNDVRGGPGEPGLPAIGCAEPRP